MAELKDAEFRILTDPTAQRIYGLQQLIGHNIQEKGFREDWDLADKLEDIASSNPSKYLESERNTVLSQAAKALRNNIIACKLALIASEITGEALETLRDTGADKLEDGNLAEELADAVIRILDLGDMIDKNIGAEIMAKVKVNQDREYKHGRTD